MRNELKKWFDDVIRSPHSFTPTVFQIGWKGKKSSEIPAFGPCKTEGAKNQSHMITQWDTPGDFAEYRIRIHRAGIYEISITCNSRKENKGIVLRATCEGFSTQKPLDGSASSSLGKLKLIAGEHIFKLTVVSIPAGISPDLKIKTIHFNLQ